MELSELTVRGYHLDQHGHVNNIRYMEFLEEGRYVFLDKHAAQIEIWKNRGISLFIVNININYRRASFLGDVLQVYTGIRTLRDRSGVIHQRIVRRGTDEEIAEADVTFVVVDVKQEKALPIEGLLHSELVAMSEPYSFLNGK
jgi:thioesterase III